MQLTLRDYSGQDKYAESRNKNTVSKITHRKDTFEENAYIKSVKGSKNKLVREVEINLKKEKCIKNKDKNNSVNAC